MLGAIEQAAGALERDHGVLERRYLGIVRDQSDFLELLAHAGFDGGDEMCVLNLVERRVVIRQRAFFQQRIIGIGGGHGGDLRSVEQCASGKEVSESHKTV